MSSLFKRRPRRVDPGVIPDVLPHGKHHAHPHPAVSALSSLVFRPMWVVPICVLCVLIGWHTHAYLTTCSRRFPGLRSSSSSLSLVFDPPWYLADTSDDFFSRLYVNNLSGVRTLNNSAYFTGLCGRYRFDDSRFPSVSIIVTLQNEQPQMLTLTVHTLLARTPAEMLEEIIIVDDNGSGSLRESVDESELISLAAHPKVSVMTNVGREGVARSRMRGARGSSGEVLVFVDSHVEMLSSTWCQHLILPILEKADTLAAQTLDILSDVDWTYGPGSGDLLYGVINDDFWFSYQRERFPGPDSERPGRRVAYETPFAAGSLFAVRRDTFFRIGGYDEGMFVWGGENTDFAIKMWCCGGRVVMVPCSRVGHMYRMHIKKTGRWPPIIPDSLMKQLGFNSAFDYRVRGVQADNFTKVITRNNIRVMERWARKSSARSGYYARLFGNVSLPREWQVFAEQMETDRYARAQEASRRRNGCRDFDWFDRHVYVKLTGVHHPWHPNTTGRTWV